MNNESTKEEEKRRASRDTNEICMCLNEYQNEWESKMNKLINSYTS